MVKIFLDGADAILENADNPLISGFTTNPSLCRKAGITNYKDFALKILPAINSKPLSIEVLTDRLPEMIEQANEISSWGENIYVKIPITNTKGQSTYNVIRQLTESGIKVNVTAIMTLEQVRHILPALHQTKGAYISIFAGRIADTGRNPVPTMRMAAGITTNNVELIWASPREVYNVYQADMSLCDIITWPSDMIKKLSLKRKDLTEFSLETVKMFLEDGKGIRIR
jgi:transaldolase